MIYDYINLILDSTGDNPLDISDYVMQKTNVDEGPVYVNGINQGTSKAGTNINDRLHTRYTFSIPLIPIRQNMLQQILAKCEENEFPVTYTSARQDLDITMVAQCSLSRWQFATKDFDGQRIYHGCVITIEGK